MNQLFLFFACRARKCLANQGNDGFYEAIPLMMVMYEEIQMPNTSIKLTTGKRSKKRFSKHEGASTKRTIKKRFAGKVNRLILKDNVLVNEGNSFGHASPMSGVITDCTFSNNLPHGPKVSLK